MLLVNIMFRSNRNFCFSQNQTTYSVAFLVTAWLLIVEGFGYIQNPYPCEAKSDSPLPHKVIYLFMLTSYRNKISLNERG